MSGRAEVKVTSFTKEMWKALRKRGQFDFNKLIPEPKRIGNTVTDDVVDDCIILYLVTKMKNADTDTLMQAFEKYQVAGPFRPSYGMKDKTPAIDINMPRAELEDKMRKTIDGQSLRMYYKEERYTDHGHTADQVGRHYVKLMDETGYKNWLNWRVANWGCYVDACRTEYDAENETLWFTTKGLPVEILESLCAKYPDAPFSITFWVDDGSGGVYRGKNKNGEWDYDIH